MLKKPAAASTGKDELKLVKRNKVKIPAGYIMMGKTYWVGASGKNYIDKLQKVIDKHNAGSIKNPAEAKAFMQSLDA